MVNLLGGPGESEVFLDDLEIRPVPEGRPGGVVEVRATGRALGGDRSPAAQPRERAAWRGSRSPGPKPARKDGERCRLSALASDGDRRTGCEIRPSCAGRASTSWSTTVKSDPEKLGRSRQRGLADEARWMAPPRATVRSRVLDQMSELSAAAVRRVLAHRRSIWAGSERSRRARTSWRRFRERSRPYGVWTTTIRI